jgi:hypothetical protein
MDELQCMMQLNPKSQNFTLDIRHEKPYNKIVPQGKPQMTIHLNNIYNINTCTDAHTSVFPSQSADFLLYTICNNKAAAHIRK